MEIIGQPKITHILRMLEKLYQQEYGGQWKVTERRNDDKGKEHGSAD